MKKNLCLLLVCLLLATSCGNTTEADTVNSETNISGTTDTVAAETEETYPGDIQDLGGCTFTFLNTEDGLWNSNSMIIDYDELTGDTLNDSIFNRNRLAETELNFKLAPVIRFDIFALNKEIQRTVLAAESLYDAAYICNKDYASIMPYTCNLYDIDAIHLTEDWWSPSFAESMTVGNSYLYASMDYINNSTQLYSSSLYFNRAMVIDYSLDSPYELVQNGKWTLDAMKSMMAAVVNLNGDNNFDPVLGGKCVYGHISQHEEAPLSLMQGTGNGFVTKDENNMLTITADFNGIVDTYNKVMLMCKEDGYNMLVNTKELQGREIFLEGRALFHQNVLTIALSDLFRNSDTQYGIVPMPKYDEAQSQYYTPLSQYGMLVTIPLTATDVDRSGYVMDYMNWVSLRDVYPNLLTSMCYKGVRDEDSIEMLNIILTSTTADIGFLWNISQSLQMTMAGNAVKGTEEVISVIQKEAKSMQTTLDNYISEYFTK